MVEWVDQRRIWFLGIGLAIGAVNVVLEMTGQLSSIQVLVAFGVALILAIVFVVRAQRSSRLALGLGVAALLIAGDVIAFLVKPANHPLITVLLIAVVVVAFVVGFPIGLYSDSGLKSRDV